MEPDPLTERFALKPQADLIAAAWRQVAGLHARRSSSPPATAVRSGDASSPTARSVADFVPGYRIDREIQRGGQGVVFAGEQLSTRRTVAIKVLRTGPLAGPADHVRFEREVYILAQLRHPNIVTIHDSGRSDDASYFVMDYIPGLHLDTYVERQRPSVVERLRLFATICEAVSRAHVLGVVHRDLKPSNIRVDPAGEPHILDFGLAKLTGHDRPREAEDSDLTMTGQFVGTYPWASPEQMSGAADAIDLRTDVYALGVMLYQLLTGVFPYDVSGSPREIADNILQVDPKPPRLLNRGLDRDVSAIVLKALRKAPDQRYQSAGELGADIERYLNGQPIDAKRDSAAYLLRKYVARHAVWASIAAGYVVLTTIGFFVALGFWLDAVRAHDAEAEQRNLAERARIEAVTNAQRARDNEARAVANADRAHAVTRFLQTMLVAADPTMDQGPKTPIREVLDFAAKQLDEGEFADAPLAEAGARSALGRTYVRLGLYDAAAKHLDRALQLDLEHRNAGDVVVAEDYNHLGLLAKEQGRFDEAITYYQTALDRLAAGDGDSAALERSVLHNLAVLLRERGSLDEAAGALQRVVELERALQPDDPVRAWTLNTVGLLQRDLGRMEEAEAAFKETLQVLESAYGRDHIYVAAVLDSLGATYALRGGYDAAEPLYLEALAIRQRVLDPNHPHISTSLNNIGFHYFSRERYDDAEPYYLQALAHRRAHLGDQHPSTATSLNNLGLLYARRGAVDEAEPLYREALAIKEATYGVSHRSTLLQMRNLSAVLREREAFAEAEQFSKAALDGYIALFPDGHWRIADQRGEWAACLMGLGRAKEAEQQLLLAHEGLAAELGPDHDRTQDVVQALVRFYQDQRDEAQVVFWQGRLVADPVGRSSTVSD